MGKSDADAVQDVFTCSVTAACWCGEIHPEYGELPPSALQRIHGSGRTLQSPCYSSNITIRSRAAMGVMRFVYMAKADARFRLLKVSTAESAVCAPVNL